MDDTWRQTPRDRRARIAAELERLDDIAPATPIVDDWRARAARHDVFWDIRPGDLVPDAYRVRRPAYAVGDEEGRDD